MKKILIPLLVILFSLTQTGITNAGINLKVTYKVLNVDSGDSSPHSNTFQVGSAEARVAKKEIASLGQTNGVKSKFLSECRKTDEFNSRVKVTDSSGRTAGLGNLRIVSVTDVVVTEAFDDLPAYSEEERASIEEEYGTFYWEYPGYEKDGWVEYSLWYKCAFSGSVSITPSNFYRVYVNGRTGPDYSKSELTKMKWSITLG